MRRETLPLLRVRRSRTGLEEVTVGPCAAWTLLAIVIVLALTVLLIAGVVEWRDIVLLLHAVAMFAARFGG